MLFVYLLLHGFVSSFPFLIYKQLVRKEVFLLVAPNIANCSQSSKGGEIRDTKILNLSRNIVSLQVFLDVSRFSPYMINLPRNKNICCGLKKVVAKSRAQVYFEQQILALLLVFHQTHNLSRNKFARALAYQPISAPHFFNPQQMFLLRVKLIKQGEKRETSTKTCNQTMLRDKLRVFVSRISPPQDGEFTVVQRARSKSISESPQSNLNSDSSRKNIYIYFET